MVNRLAILMLRIGLLSPSTLELVTSTLTSSFRSMSKTASSVLIHQDFRASIIARCNATYAPKLTVLLKFYVCFHGVEIFSSSYTVPPRPQTSSFQAILYLKT